MAHNKDPDASLSEVHQSVDTTNLKKPAWTQNTFIFWPGLSCKCWLYGSGQLGH